ncbi:YSIRK-type signal peptide-containing protein, partial [Mammaliicoccus sciuri]
MKNKQRYSIRKFTVGAGSVLIGLTIYAANDGVVNASEINNTDDFKGNINKTVINGKESSVNEDQELTKETPSVNEDQE